MKLIVSSGWFYSFIIGWVALLLLIDWHSFKKNIWGGIVCSILELYQDGIAVHFGLYRLHNVGIYLLGTSVFFTLGIAFTMGVLFMQYLPGNNKLQLIHILVFSNGFLLFEFLVAKYGLLTHIHYSYALSFFLNILIMGSLAWFKQLVYVSKLKWGGIMWKYYLYVTLEGVGIYIWCKIINMLDKKYPTWFTRRFLI